LTGVSLQVDRTFDVGGLSIRVHESGNGSPFIVLHHSTGPFWTPFYDRLAESFTVMAPDLPGFGSSERPTDARSPRDLAIRCLQLLDQLDTGPVGLAGFGLGGWVAAEMATMNQRAFTSLALIGAAGIKPRNGYIYDPMMGSYTEYARLGFANDERFERTLGIEPAPQLVELWDYSREMTARVTWRPWMWSGQLPGLLRGVKTPSLVVWGDSDRIIPLDCGEQYAELIPNARLEIIEEAGHVVDIEQPDVLADLIADFAASQGR
jgi:pimeloyl-ACP methyl ester carboxylesterase